MKFTKKKIVLVVVVVTCGSLYRLETVKSRVNKEVDQQILHDNICYLLYVLFE